MNINPSGIPNLLKHLLPSGRAWYLRAQKNLTKYLMGFHDALVPFFKELFDLVWGDNFPETTRELDQWETTKNLPMSEGLTEAQRRSRLAAAFKATGGQSPRYIQDTLQNAGFNVFIHEWWIPGTSTPRDPRVYLGPFTGGNIPEYVCGDPDVVCGDPDVVCGASIGLAGYALVNKPGPVLPIPSDPATWPYFLYFGGETFPSSAVVDAGRRDEFERLLLTICPAHLWIGILADYQTEPPVGTELQGSDGLILSGSDGSELSGD